MRKFEENYWNQTFADPTRREQFRQYLYEYGPKSRVMLAQMLNERVPEERRAQTRVVDLGCGPQIDREIWHQYKYVGVDIAACFKPDKLLDIRKDYDFIGSCEFIYARHVFEHLPAAEVDQVLKDMLWHSDSYAAVTFFIPPRLDMTPYQEVVNPDDGQFYNIYNRMQLENAAKSAGFNTTWVEVGDDRGQVIMWMTPQSS